jgi:tetrahydromethanopterin S-methyltransferase subunit B
MSDDKYPLYCRKEAEIAKMQNELAMIKGFVMGNGKEGLAVSVPRLADNVQDLRMTVANLDRNLDKVVGKQDRYEGEKGGKEVIRKRNRWIIGILITVATTLIGVILFMIERLMNHLPV